MRDEGQSFQPMVTCRRCVQLGIAPCRAIVAVVGWTVGGDEALSCGHVQEYFGKLADKEKSK